MIPCLTGNKNEPDIHMMSEASLHFLDNLNLFFIGECWHYLKAYVMVSSRSKEGQQNCSNCQRSPSLQGAQPFSSPCPRCPSRPQSVWWGRWTFCRGKICFVKSGKMHDTTGVFAECLFFFWLFCLSCLKIKVLLTFKYTGRIEPYQVDKKYL